MATDKIKGLTVKIGADTSDFIKGLKSVDREIKQTQKYANELQSGLELKFDSRRFTEAQKQIQKALTETEEKAEAIRKQLKFLEDTGNVDTEGYEKLQTELVKTENQAVKLKDQLDKIDKLKFENATKGLTDLSKNLENAAKKTAVLSAAAVGAIAGIVKLGKDAVKTGDEIQTTADQYNLSAETIQKWNYIAMQSDVASEQLYKAMTKTRSAIGTFVAGGSDAATQALEKLFGSLQNIPKDTEGAFESIILQLSKVEDSTLQAYYANEIFGEKLATVLIPLLKQGADGISEFAKEFEAVGYLSNEQVAMLSEYDNKLNEVTQRWNNAKTELGIALIPLLEKLTDILTVYVIPAIKKLAEWFDKLPEPMQNVVIGLALLVAGLAPVLLIASKIIGIIPSLIKMFSGLKAASLSTYVGVASLAGALGLVFDLIGNWSEMSALEKVLKSLALAFLVAAAAATIFHASWSVGLAVGAIAAAVTAGIAAISSAGQSLGLDTDFSSEKDIQSEVNRDYKIPTSSGSSNTYNEDNSQYNINVNLNASGELNYDAKQLADEVIKQIVVAKQSSGR